MAGERRRILLIEDDASLRKLLERMLVSSGYDVMLAEHGLDGLVKIDRAQPKPDLLIVDVMMPELDGITLVRALRGHTETRKIPVIFLTAKSDAKTVAEGISVGAKYYITKPFRVEDLLTKVQRALGA